MLLSIFPFRRYLMLLVSAALFLTQLEAQTNPVISKIIEEGTSNSELKPLAHQLIDQIGPRLVGTPKMQRANEWAVNTYAVWGIQARNEAWGQWKDWERGVPICTCLYPECIPSNVPNSRGVPPPKKVG